MCEGYTPLSADKRARSLELLMVRAVAELAKGGVIVRDWPPTPKPDETADGDEG